jgi:hypothetical protein
MTPMDEKPFIKIAVIDNIIEAQIISSSLEEENIPYRLRSFHDTAYDGLFQFQKGYGEILAPEKYKTVILEIISNIKAEGERVFGNSDEDDPNNT